MVICFHLRSHPGPNNNNSLLRNPKTMIHRTLSAKIYADKRGPFTISTGVRGRKERPAPYSTQVNDLSAKRMFLTHRQEEICCWNKAGPPCFQALFPNFSKRTACKKLTPMAGYLTSSFTARNTTNRSFICWHTGPGHSWKQDVLLLLFLS